MDVPIRWVFSDRCPHKVGPNDRCPHKVGPSDGRSYVKMDETFTIGPHDIICVDMF